MRECLVNIACITYMATGYLEGMPPACPHLYLCPGGEGRGGAGNLGPIWSLCSLPETLLAEPPQTGSSARCWLQTPDPAQSANIVTTVSVQSTWLPSSRASKTAFVCGGLNAAQ